MSSAPTLSIRLPTDDRRLETYTVRGAAPFAATTPAQPFTRVAYSAAHVVADPSAATDPWLTAALDWDATIACRQRLWSLGLGVAEAMDTAQGRNQGGERNEKRLSTHLDRGVEPGSHA